MRTYPTKATLLATTKAVILQLANHPALATAQRQRTLARLPQMNYSQATYCAGWLQLRTEWRPDALRQVEARTKALKGRQLRQASPACQASATVSYIRCPTSKRLVERPAGSTLPLHLVIDAN